MQDRLIYVKPRYRENTLKIQNGIISMVHKDKITNGNKIDHKIIIRRYGNINRKNITKKLLNVDDMYNIYCPNYLNNIIKPLVKKNATDDEYNKLYDMLKDNLNILSIYEEQELIDIFVETEKLIWELIKSDSYNLFEYVISYDLKSCSNELCNILLNKTDKLEKILNSLVSKIGIPLNIKTTKSGKEYTTWNNFILYMIFCYLYIQICSCDRLNDLYEKGNIFENISELKKYTKEIVIGIMRYIKQKEINSRFISPSKQIKINSKSITVRKIYSIKYFIANYIDNHYGEYKDLIPFYIADHNIIDILEEHRDYLFNRAKTDKKRCKVENYTYEQLAKKYNRKIKGY